MKTATAKKRLLKTAEVAERLATTPHRVRLLARQGVLPAKKLGPRGLRFDLDEVLATLPDATDAKAG